MKRLYSFIVLLGLFLMGLPTWADTKPVYSDAESEQPYGCTQMTKRRALVGPHCMVNRVFNTVKVASMTHNLSNLTDENLTNAASFPSLVDVGLGYTPITSVRDLQHHYAKGVTAGFCLRSASPHALLSLDVVKTYKLVFYNEGKQVGGLTSVEGLNVEGLKLSLFNLPGDSSVCINIQGKAPGEFDEVELVAVKGISLDALGSVGVKYAYVGVGKTYAMVRGETAKALNDKADGTGNTLYNMAQYAKDYGRTIDLPGITGHTGNVVDDNLTNFHLYGVLLNIGYIGHASAYVEPADNKGELFKKGSMVGFKCSGLSLLGLNLAHYAVITLYNAEGKPVQSSRIDANLLSLNLVQGGGDGTLMCEADSAFSSVAVDLYGVAVNVGGNGIYYAFVQPAPDVEHHCPIRISADMNICSERKNLQLNHNEKVPVTWSVVEWPGSDKNDETYKPTIDQNGYVTFKQVDGSDNGTYKFCATASKNYCATPYDLCKEYVTVTRGINAYNELATHRRELVEEDPETGVFQLADHTHGGGSLISISGASNQNKLLNTDLTDYVTVTGGLAIADHVEVVGVKTKNNTPIIDEVNSIDKANGNAPSITEGHYVNMGFVASMEQTGLSLKLLHGFSIHCYDKDGKDIYHHIVSQSDVLGLSLIENNKLQRITLGVSVPYDKAKQVTEFALFKGGVLQLSLDRLDLYYPYVEDSVTAATEDNPLGCAPLTVSNSSSYANVVDGASIDNNLSGNAGAVDALSFMENMSNVVDDNLSTAMTWGGVAKVGGKFSVAVNMGRTLDYRHVLGVVTDSINYNVLGVKAGTWLKVETYYHGKPTGDSKSDWGVLGVDLVTYNHKQNVYLMSPKHKYDEVVITMGAVANVLHAQGIYGIVLQSDADGDGIPDCKDPESCQESVKNIKATETCEGNDITVSWTGHSSTTYYVDLPDQDSDPTKDNLQKIVAPESPETPTCSATVKATKPGVYFAMIYNSDKTLIGTVEYKVHPQVTVWSRYAADHDWYKWDNWSNGVPYFCTDVVIPSSTTNWPVLDAPNTTEKKMNGCHYIHFEPGAAVENAFRLVYDKAWVDLTLTPDEQSLWVAPLQQTYSGDFFCFKTPKPYYFYYFTPLTEDVAAENRLYPRVYQRMWKSAEGQSYDKAGKHTSATIVCKSAVATWSHNFNAVAQPYSPTAYSNGSSNGIALKPFSLTSKNHDDNDLSTDTIRLPKAAKDNKERTYNYYNDLGQTIGFSQTVEHGDLSYRFGYEVNSKLMKSADDNIVDDTYKGKGKLVFNEDNPMVVHYTTAEGSYTDDNGKSQTTSADGVFLVGNPVMSHMSVSKFLKENSLSSMTKWNGNTATSVVIVNGVPVGTGTNTPTMINPAEAFFVVSESKPSTLDLTYNADMFNPWATDATATTTQAKAFDAAPQVLSTLRINAMRGNYHAGTLLIAGHDAKALTILDSEVQPKLALFTIDGGKAYDIRPIDTDNIPLGIIASDSVTLDFSATGSTNLDEWQLYDNTTGMTHGLGQPITLHTTGTLIGRYELRHGHATAVTAAETGNDLTIEAKGSTITVTSHGTLLSSATVTTVGGMTLDSTQPNAHTATLHARPGVCVVSVQRQGLPTAHYKVLCR